MPAKRKAPYGSWKSPITTDLMLSESVGLGEIQIFQNEIYWIETRPREQGRYVIIKRTNDNRQIDLLPPEYNARTRVHEYGGGSYLPTIKGVFFTNFNDQDIYLITPDKTISRITDNPACRYADLIYDKHHERIICVREAHSDKNQAAINTLVSISLNKDNHESILMSGADFYSNPRLSHDGKRLCGLAGIIRTCLGTIPICLLPRLIMMVN